MIKHTEKAIFASLALLMVAGCASKKEPTFASAAHAHGGVISKLGDSWEEGRRMVAEGKKTIEKGGEKFKKGRALMEEGEADRARGSEMIEIGQRKQQEAEIRYQEMQSVPPQAALGFMQQ